MRLVGYIKKKRKTRFIVDSHLVTATTTYKSNDAWMQTGKYEFYIWFPEPLGICQGDILQETKLFVQ
jgi:hypothetical protein